MSILVVGLSILKTGTTSVGGLLYAGHWKGADPGGAPIPGSGLEVPLWNIHVGIYQFQKNGTIIKMSFAISIVSYELGPNWD
jgi:hypothetical protein